MLTAVQSLRLACTEGASTENAELGLSAPRCGLGERGSRDGLGGRACGMRILEFCGSRGMESAAELGEFNAFKP